ncbi:hypothetical protein [Kaarinaea lacus]
MTNHTQAPYISEAHSVATNPANRFLDLPRLLRSIGAMSLLAAISIFLLQGWEAGNDIYRYLLLLGHTVGLAVIGFASGHWLRESKGARLLLIIALASVPANFAILGAFLYSQVSMDAVSMIYPSMAHWQVDSINTAIMASIGAAVILAPVIWLGFMVLSRKSARRLTLLFLIANAILLVPVRAPEYVAVLLLALTVFVAKFSLKAAADDTALRTAEGFIARLLLYVPIGVIVGRNIWLYAADGFMFSVLSIVVYILFRQVSIQLKRDSSLRAILEVGSLLPAVTFGLGVCSVVADMFNASDALMFPLFAVSVSVMLLELSTRAANGALAYRRVAAVVLTVTMVTNLILFSSVVTAAVCLMVGLLVLVYGYMVEQRVVFALGAITLLAGLIYQMQFAVDVFNLGSWGSLAALGVAAILIGSTIERHGAKIKLKMTNWSKKFKAWEN